MLREHIRLDAWFLAFGGIETPLAEQGGLRS